MSEKKQVENKQVNMSINDGAEFYAHELSINFNPMHLILDFKCITPRNDIRSKDVPYISMKHNVVLVDPYHAKRIYELLGDVISKYEKQFGRIDMPKALKKWEQDRKKEMKDNQKQAIAPAVPSAVPSYLG